MFIFDNIVCHNITLMLYKLLALLAIFFCVFGLANGQPLRKTNWITISKNATTDGYSYPRVASFKSGNYAVIFGYKTENDTSVTQLQLVNATTGTIKWFNEEYSTQYGGGLVAGPFTAHNIYVFPDDTAYAIWQGTGTAKCIGFPISSESAIPTLTVFYQQDGVWNATDYLDIAGSNWLYYVIGYSGETSVIDVNFLATNSQGSLVPSSIGLVPAIIHSAVSSKLYSTRPAIFTVAVAMDQSGYFTIQGLNDITTYTYDDTMVNAQKAIPFVVDSLDVVACFFVCSDGKIQLLVLDTFPLNQLYQIEVARNADSYFVPSVLQISDNVVLLAFSTTSKRINYQMVKLSRTTAVLIGPEVTHDAPSTSMSVSIANTTGSDIVVVAKDVTGTQILSRTITFCGNGALELKEECDGSSGCTSQCKCQIGTVAVNGTCLDQCQNGIVTGSEDCDSGTGCVECKCALGYKPMSPRSQGCDLIPKEFVPNVKPQFDCLEMPPGGILLHFSYINNDGFDETISYGALNSFAPATLGSDRPTVFIAGQALTYPASPYSTELTSDTSSVTWILTSYNLTVDLTNPSSLMCPKNLSVTLTMSTFGNLTDALVQKLLQNIAEKYNISESRLNATYTLQSTNEQGLNTYVIVITISPSETSLELPPIDVVKDLLNDIQTSKENLVSELTKGLEEINPVIKSITPSVIETRGSSAVPISVFSPNSDPTGEVSLGGTRIFSIYLLILALIFVLLI